MNELAPYLIGIEWGIISKWEPVCDSIGNPVGRPPENLQVDTNSAMMAVVPFWKLNDLLNHPIMVEARQKENERLWGHLKSPIAALTYNDNNGRQ